MRSSSTNKKPLLVIFPLQQDAHYLRCLSIASYLGRYFNICFLHADRYAPYIYQQGYDTFSCLSLVINTSVESDDPFSFFFTSGTRIEAVFLDQVRSLETLQPALILGDYVATLSMASEYTGIPFISLRSAFDTPYYTPSKWYSLSKNEEDKSGYISTIRSSYDNDWRTECKSGYHHFKAIRDRYGLQQKPFYKEWEGSVNWIYDLPKLFPLQELPFRYENIGPLYYSFSSLFYPFTYRINPIKKTVLVTMGDDHHAWKSITFLQNNYFQKYNIIIIADNEHIVQGKHILSYPLEAITTLLPKADLIICIKNSPFLYQALSEGIPVLYTSNKQEEAIPLGVLQQLQLGAVLDTENPEGCKKVIQYWIEQKNSDAHRNLQYALKASLTEQHKKIERSLTIHFPVLSRHTIAQ